MLLLNHSTLLLLALIAALPTLSRLARRLRRDRDEDLANGLRSRLRELSGKGPYANKR